MTLLLSFGCENYYSESFIQEKKPRSLYYEGLIDKQIPKEFKVDDVVVYIIVESSHWKKIDKNNNYRVGPYTIWLGLETTGQANSAVIHNMEINSKLGNIYTISNDKFPLSLEFKSRVQEKNNTVKSFKFISYQLTNKLNLEFLKNEVLNIKVDIEILKKDTQSRRIINYDFFPKVEDIFVQSMGV